MEESILITGGVGDFLTIESFMTNVEKESLTHMFFATRACKLIEEIIKTSKIFPNLKSTTVLWDDFNKFFAFYKKEEVISAIIKKSHKLTQSLEKNKIIRLQSLLKPVKDFSIAKIFAEIPNYRHYNTSGFLNLHLADIKNFNLPNEYFVVCPYTINDKRRSNRDFSKSDWNNLLIKLTNENKIGVILNIGSDEIPIHNNLLNLSNKTTFLESTEILKHAMGYIGIDSSLSVLAAKLFNFPNLIIKSNNSHCYTNKHIYYAPQKKFNFLKSRI